MTGGEQDEVENRQCQKRVRRKPGRSKDTAANPLRNTLQRDIEDLLLRYFLSSPQGLSSLSFDAFKQCWRAPDKHFSMIHYIFATSRVDYRKLLQTMFQITLSYLDCVPVEKLFNLAPELYAPNQADSALLLAAWNMSVVFCLYCIHSTQFEVNYQDTKATNKSHVEISGHYELDDKTPIRISMSLYLKLIMTANLQFSHFVDTHLGRCTLSILDRLVITNAFCFSAFEGPVLHEEFDEIPGNTSNHIVKSINLEEIWVQKLRGSVDLAKKSHLIAETFVSNFVPMYRGDVVNENPLGTDGGEEKEEEEKDEEVFVDKPKARTVKNQIVSSVRRPVYIGYKGSKVKEHVNTKADTRVRRPRKEAPTTEVEPTPMEREGASREAETKSSEMLAEELAAMFDVPSSSNTGVGSSEPPPVAVHINYDHHDHKMHMEELTKLERDTDEVLNMGIIDARNGKTSKSRGTSNRYSTTKGTSKVVSGSAKSAKTKTIGRGKAAPTQNHLDILKSLEDNLCDILDS